MFSYKVKLAVIVLLALGTIASGVGFLAHHGTAAQSAPKSSPASQPPPPKEDGQEGKPIRMGFGEETELKPRPASTPEERAELLKARIVMASMAYRRELEGLKKTRRFGDVLILEFENPEILHTWSVRWLQAERALKPKREDQVAALEAHFQRMAKLKQLVNKLSRDLIPKVRVSEAEWYLLEAELWLGEAKAAKK